MAALPAPPVRTSVPSMSKRMIGMTILYRRTGTVGVPPTAGQRPAARELRLLLKHLLQFRQRPVPVPGVPTFEAVNHEVVRRAECFVCNTHSLARLFRPFRLDERVVRPPLPDRRSRGDQGTDFRHIAILQESRNHLCAATVL